MRRVLFVLLAAGSALSASGCYLPIYSSDPQRRVRQLINTSEDLRQIENEWERFWFTDHPSHLSFERVDGALQ